MQTVLAMRVDIEDKRNKEALREAVSKIVEKYRNKLGEKGRPLSFARFAWDLTAHNRERGSKVSVTYQTIKNWADGIHIPEYLLMLRIAEESPEGTWQHEFSTEIMSVYYAILIVKGLSSR